VSSSSNNESKKSRQKSNNSKRSSKISNKIKSNDMSQNLNSLNLNPDDIDLKKRENIVTNHVKQNITNKLNTNYCKTMTENETIQLNQLNSKLTEVELELLNKLDEKSTLDFTDLELDILNHLKSKVDNGVLSATEQILM